MCGGEGGTGRAVPGRAAPAARTRMPCPLSWICSSLRPPPLAVTAMLIEPASRLFSSISLSALLGRWMTSPAAMRLITCWSSCLIACFGCSPGSAPADMPPSCTLGGRGRTKRAANSSLSRGRGTLDSSLQNETRKRKPTHTHGAPGSRSYDRFVSSALALRWWFAPACAGRVTGVASGARGCTRSSHGHVGLRTWCTRIVVRFDQCLCQVPACFELPRTC